MHGMNVVCCMNGVCCLLIYRLLHCSFLLLCVLSACFRFIIHQHVGTYKHLPRPQHHRGVAGVHTIVIRAVTILDNVIGACIIIVEQQEFIPATPVLPPSWTTSSQLVSSSWSCWCPYQYHWNCYHRGNHHLSHRLLLQHLRGFAETSTKPRSNIESAACNINRRSCSNREEANLLPKVFVRGFPFGDGQQMLGR